VRDAVEPAPPEEDRVDMGFWHDGAHGALRSERSITAASWPEIRDNYTAQAAAAIDRLTAVTPGDIGGRLRPSPGHLHPDGERGMSVGRRTEF